MTTNFSWCDAPTACFESITKCTRSCVFQLNVSDWNHSRSRAKSQL